MLANCRALQFCLTTDQRASNRTELTGPPGGELTSPRLVCSAPGAPDGAGGAAPGLGAPPGRRAGTALLGPRTRAGAWHLVGAGYRFADRSLAVGWAGFRFALRAPVEREWVDERWEASYLCCWLNLHRHFLPVGGE